MGEKKRPHGVKGKQIETAGHSAPLRLALRTLFRAWVKSDADKRSLAKFLGQSTTSLSNLARGDGSLNTWWSVILWQTDKTGPEVAEALYAALKHFSPPSEADRLWNALDVQMTANEKLYWVKVIQVAAEVDRDLKDS